MKKLWVKMAVATLLSAGLLLHTATVPAEAAIHVAQKAAWVKSEHIGVWVDGQKVKLTAPVYKADDVAVAPMKELFGALYASAVLEEKTQTIIVRDGWNTISLQIGALEVLVNGRHKQLAAAAVMVDGSPYVPVRAMAELLGATVQWDGKNNAIRIASKYYNEPAAGEAEVNVAAEEAEMIAYSAEDMVDLFDESVVMIQTNQAQGSGVVIGENLILTNYHVMEEATSATVYTIYGDQIEVAGLAVWSVEADLAIIKTKEALDINPVELSYSFWAPKGARVFAIGSPFGLQNTISEGLISNWHFEDGVSYIQTNAPVDHGSSGGALFNEYGQLVGIVTSVYETSIANLNFAVAAHEAALLYSEMTEEDVAEAAFLPPSLPDKLTGASLDTIRKTIRTHFSSVYTKAGPTELKKWDVVRDKEGWLVFSAQIDSLLYLYEGPTIEDDLRYWTVHLGHELHRVLPGEQIQFVLYFERDYSFKPRGLASGEATQLSNGKWRVRYAVIDMQLKDQMYIQTRF